jgi:molecular chaperone DnaK (HSP70)
MEDRFPGQDGVAGTDHPRRPAPMRPARFGIGIDLGTTNCAMAFAPLDREARSELLDIPQRETLSSLVDAPTLPSFLYLPEDAVAAQIQRSNGAKREWIIGRLARKTAADLPGRVAHSAKSWLSHHAADRSARFMPWGSEDIAHDEKVSPVTASALILNHLKNAWNSQFGGSGFEFNDQDITITVPASFDAAAQRLTLAAAAEAGFPDTVRLLEEPQAALYCWLEQHGSAKELWDTLPDQYARGHHLLVIDVGGGTSDFSLFEFRSDPRSSVPQFRRVAVSEHILLGGDNVDLAIAHFVEPRLLGNGRQLSAPQWDHLVAGCRDVKERALSSAGPPDETFPVLLPGRGSDLVAGLRSAQLTRAEIERVLLEGFFPECDANARPYRKQAALREWGLPYASDSAVTRHLAAFLRDHRSVDAVLLNGGSLSPPLVHQRIYQQIGKWRGDFPPLLLKNQEPGLAVARGAARFGSILSRKADRIAAGAAHAIFLEVHREPAMDLAERAAPSLVCVLPQGASPEEQFEIANPSLELHTNRLVRFQAYASSRSRSQVGEVAHWSEHEFHALPPLETIAKIADQHAAETKRTLPVRLKAKINELGLLQVACASVDPNLQQSWPLEFNLRPHQQNQGRPGSGTISEPPGPAGPNIAADVLDAARKRIASVFTKRLNGADKLAAPRLFKSLEQILGMSKSDWNGVLVRSLWPAVEPCTVSRRESVEHEEAWLILAGFLLRPGFGVSGDQARIDSLWSLRETGLHFPGKRIKCQEYILWRRVAGGLTPARQEKILTDELENVHGRRNPHAELIRMAGSLERLAHSTKTELTIRFIRAAADLAYDKKPCAPYLAALGLLLNRAPLYAGPEAVVSPDLVEAAYEAFRSFDWTGPELSELQTLFLRAARVVGNRSLDLPKSLRNQIADKLDKSGVAPLRTGKLREFAPVGRWDRISLYGESLPPGLIFSENPI